MERSPVQLDAPSRPCPNCGQDIDENASACPACGHLFVDARCDRHPDRAATGRCAVCGTAVCDEDDIDGPTHHLCRDHHHVGVVDGWAQVYSTSDDLEASLIRDNLRAEGLDAEILSQKDHFSLPTDLGDLSPVRVLVPVWDYETASAVLAEHMDEEGQVSFEDKTAEPG
ncbi:MAG: DUF2007 domain-containing protein [Gemmatimonadota bacterium]